MAQRPARGPPDDGTPTDDRATEGRSADDRPSPWTTRGAVLARRTHRPVSAERYPHDCRATQPGWLPWLLWALLALWAVASLLRLHVRLLDWMPATDPSWRAAMVAVAVFALFWLVGWEMRRSPRGILLGLGDRNVCSLSIGQAMAWTALLIAVTVVAALTAAGLRAVDNLGTLQAGIGVGAAAGTSLALSGKAGQGLKPHREALNKSARQALERGPEPYVRDLVKGEVEATRSTAQAVTRLRQVVSDKDAVRILSKIARGTPLDRALGTKGPLAGLAGDLAGLRGELQDSVQGYLKDARSGVVYANQCPCEARLKDMVQGDETANTYQLDPNKLQFLALSLVGMFVYMATVLKGLDQPFGLTQDYPGGVLAALGLSGASYVGFKIPVQTQTEEGA